MADISRKFVVATQEIDTPQGDVVEKDDVGARTSKDKTSTSIFLVIIF